MIVALDIVLSVLFIAFGYVSVCCYFNKCKWSFRNTEVLKLTKNKVIYLFTAVCFCTVLIIVFQFVYNLSMLQQIKLLSLILIILPVSAIDLRVQIIPNRLLTVGLIIRCLLFAAEFIAMGAAAVSVLLDSIIGSAVIGLFFLLLLLIFKNSIGMGDVKLFALMGLYQGLWGVINSVFCSLVVSFVLSVILLITKKKKRKDTISFGPSILLGTFIAIAYSGM